MSNETRTTVSTYGGIPTALLLVLLPAIGCNIHPNFGPPGTVYNQRNRAVLHDPFPERETAPVIEGARPMGFDLPLSEPTRSQINPNANRGIYGF